MHPPRSLVFGLVVIVTVAVPAVCLAQHSWCNSGPPMVPGASDAATNQVVDYVCNQTGDQECCAADGRWSLACVARGAAYSKVIHGADPCGRYAWDQGPLPGARTHFPRGFNLVALSGNITGLTDIGGPVAAAGYIAAHSFRLNHERAEDVALVGRVGADLWDGELFGAAHYGEYLSYTGVTFLDGVAPTSPSIPIDFAAAELDLGLMSERLWDHYDSQPAQKVYSTLWFVGTDPELNVFSVTPEQLVNTYSYECNVPEGANVIINVLGSAPVLQWAGMSGTFTASKTLWNFPEATSLMIQGVGFRGSILAPHANTTLRWGSLRGTAVVASASASNEFYYEPLDVPSPGGCLDIDPTWSCSNDTTTDADGKARSVAAEAGFIELSTENYTAYLQSRTSPTHRVWYSFQPARTYPKSKPLAVFFNGGPGTATSQFLFALNTGPNTLDPTRTGSDVIASNESADWSEFANLLYIDAPGTGFSYAVKSSDGSMPSIGIDMDRDAAMFVEVILRFLDRHPDLRNNRVIVVGESYGGARAVVMFQHLFGYASLINPNAVYQDAQLHGDLVDYFEDVIGTPAPTSGQITRRFGHQVLIQPVVAGEKQQDLRTEYFNPNACMSPDCLLVAPDDPINEACNIYDCDKVEHWRDAEDLEITSRLTTVDTLERALGVDPRSIAWMNSAWRTDAYGRSDGLGSEDTPDMEYWFGPLGDDDSYFLPASAAASEAYPGARWWRDEYSSKWSATGFALDLYQGVKTFITVARYDMMVVTNAIPYALDDYAQNEPMVSLWLQTATHDALSTDFGLPRPGAMWLHYQPDGSFVVPVAMPNFYEAGHTVSLRAPIPLRSDVMKWYHDSLL